MITPSASSPPRQRGMTLVEIMISMIIAAMLFAGAFAGLLQSERLTTQSVAQNAALAAVQGYLEQMKCMTLTYTNTASPAGLVLVNTSGKPRTDISYAIATTSDGINSDFIQTTPNTVAIPDISTIRPGSTPAGVVDNLKDISADPTNAGDATTWNAVWPGATDPGTTPRRNDLHLNMWVWITDLTPTVPGSAPAQKAFGITLIYTWSYWDGFAYRYFLGSVRTIRSGVRSFNSGGNNVSN